MTSKEKENIEKKESKKVESREDVKEKKADPKKDIEKKEKSEKERVEQVKKDAPQLKEEAEKIKIAEDDSKDNSKEEESKELPGIKVGLFGEKMGMTQVFNEEGTLIPVTVIKVYPQVVIQIKTKEKEGYNAIKVAFKEAKKDALNKPSAGVFIKNKLAPYKFSRELKYDSADNFNIGDMLSAGQFQNGDFVDAQGISKGKGFQGVVKKYGFKGGPKTRGQGNSWRSAGSIGAGTDPGRVWKGHPMPGRMGYDTKTIQNLKIINVNNDKQLLLIKGSIPGPRNCIIKIKPAVKKEGFKESRVRGFK